MKYAKFLRTPYFTEYLQWLFLTVSGFQSATSLQKRFRQRCLSANFAKCLRTSFDRIPPNDCFLSLPVNFKKFFWTYLLWKIPEKLLVSGTSCRILTSRYSEKLFSTCFSSILYKRSSHSKAFVYVKSLKIICEEVNFLWSCEMPTCKFTKKTLSHILIFMLNYDSSK